VLRSFRTCQLTHILLVIGLVLAGLNPICPHSKTLIEICASDGSTQTVAVDADMNPVPSHEDHSSSKEQCPYCFSAQMAKFVTDTPVVHAPHIIVSDGVLRAGDQRPVSFARQEQYEARAPPILI